MRNRSEKTQIIELTKCDIANRFITIWYLTHYAAPYLDFEMFEELNTHLRDGRNGRSPSALHDLREPGSQSLEGTYLKKLCIEQIDRYKLSEKRMRAIAHEWRSELQSAGV